jgi:hypothetical protein
METLLLVRVGPYVELDVSEFLRFHRQVASPLTQAYHAQARWILWQLTPGNCEMENTRFALASAR